MQTGVVRPEPSTSKIRCHIFLVRGFVKNTELKLVIRSPGLSRLYIYITWGESRGAILWRSELDTWVLKGKMRRGKRGEALATLEKIGASQSEVPNQS